VRVRLPYNFQPRRYQLPSLAAHDQGFKRIFDVWHRRSGKDVTWFNQTIKKSWQRCGVYYYVLPTYRQARKVVWDGITDTGFRYLDYVPKAVRLGKPNDTEMKIRMKNGSIIQLIGSDNYDSMVGTNPVGIVWSEFALQDPNARKIMRPILVENGGWEAILTTPRGHNHAYDLWNVALKSSDWFCSLLSMCDTKRDDGRAVVSQEQYDRELAEGEDEDLLKQEYMVSFEGPNQGSYYGRWMENARQDGRISRVPHDGRLPVYTFWDLGLDDCTTIWFMQYSQREFRFIEYLEDTGKGLDSYVKILRDRPYTYAAHHLPHDVAVRELGNQAKSRKQALEDLGVRNIIVGRSLSVIDGINAARGVLGLCWFDEEKCAKGIRHMWDYKRDWDDKNEIWKDHPKHDAASHGADSFREFANSFEEVKKVMPRTLTEENMGSRGGWMR